MLDGRRIDRTMCITPVRATGRATGRAERLSKERSYRECSRSNFRRDRGVLTNEVK